MKTPVRLLVVEDSESDAKLMGYALRSAGWEVSMLRVETPSAMRSALLLGELDAVISDWALPSFSGAAALALVQELGIDLPFIIVSGTVGEEVAADAMRAGARDYVLKGKLARLGPALERELAEQKNRLAQRQAEAALKCAREELRQAQKLEAIGELAAGIAHDFNNLLSVVLGFSQLVLDDLKPDDPARSDVLEIHAAGRRAAQLTQQLLAFARRQVLTPRNVDLDAIVSGVTTMLRRLLGEQIEIVVEGTSGLNRTFVDASQIEQVILNLAVNARDAMPDGGKVSIATANVTLDPAHAGHHPGVVPGEYAMLTVSDTGMGMDSATASRIFEPFFTTKPLGKGTGLGLSTVFGIARQSGGSVVVSSELGQGTTFTLFFPKSTREDAPLTSERPGGPSQSLLGNETVLLVEDDAGVRKIALAILRRHGYVVLETASGAEAILVANAYPEVIHLLLTDLIMPGMSGKEVGRALRAARPELRVLYMSGYSDAALIDQGEIAFLQKPVTSESLARKVRDALELR